VSLGMTQIARARSATGLLRDATHWDEVATTLGCHLVRHDLRILVKPQTADGATTTTGTPRLTGHWSAGTLDDPRVAVAFQPQLNWALPVDSPPSWVVARYQVGVVPWHW